LATGVNARSTQPGTSGRAWAMLCLGVLAQAAVVVFVSTPAFLIPLLHTRRGLTLGEAGLMASAPTLGSVLTLIAWGALADRLGERWVITAGLALTALACTIAIFTDGYFALGLCFLLGGMASSSPNAASGRVVVGWFPRERRGLAMGIRQLAQPLGVAIAALTIPRIAANGNLGGALVVPLGLTALLAVACGIGLMNPPRQPQAERAAQSNPYRGNRFLVRVHAVSALLVVPQMTLSIFGLVWLITELHWTEAGAGVLVAVSQFIGGLGRVAMGVLSDRVGSRVRPLRWVAVAAAVVMLLLAVFDAAHVGGAALVFLVATTISVADNGLAFTSVAEVAGPAWAGRALGTQNTGQFIAASTVGPAVGWLIGLVGYPLAFVITALMPAIAVPMIPGVHSEHDRL
jgi:MFS family permease